jgi:O-antigen/teichoic acid export membrane protein
MSASSTSLGHRVSSAMIWNSVLFPVKFLIAFGSGVILVRLLNKHDYAQYSLILFTASLIGTWVDLGTERSVGRFTPEIEQSAGRKGLERFFLSLFGIKLAVILPVLLAFALAPDFFVHILALGDDGYVLLAGISLLVLLGAVSDAFIQFLYTHFRQIATNLLDIVASLVQPLLVIGFAVAGTGVVGVVTAMVLASGMLDVLAAWRARTVVTHIPLRAGEMPRNLWRRFANVSALNFLLTSTTSLADPSFAALVLTGDKQLTAVAVLAVGYRFVQYFLRFLVAPLTGIQTPLFARLYSEKRMNEVREAYSTLTKFFVFALVPCGVGMILLAPRLIPFLFTATYVESAAVAVVLVTFLFGETITSIPASMLIVFEESRATIWSRVISILSVPLLFVLVPPLGAVGASFAIGAPRLASRMFSTWFTGKHYGTRFPYAFFLRVTIASLVAGIPLFITRDWDWVWVAVATALFAILFTLLFKLLGGFDASEKARLATLKLPFKEVVLKWL